MLSRLHMPAPRLRRLHARLWLVAASLCTGVVLAAAVVWFAVSSRQAAIDDAVREMRNDALMLAEDQDRLLLAVDVVQRSIIDTLRGIGADTPDTYAQLLRTQSVQQNLQDRIAGLPYVAAVLLFDSHGTLLNYSRGWPPPPLIGEDRDFIRDMEGAAAPALFISEPSHGKVSGLPRLYLSRRFNTADGQLLGFVVSAIDVAYFEHMYAKLPLTGGGAYTLLRRDGRLLARYPAVDLLDGLFDGKDRIAVLCAMPHFPVAVSVSDTLATVLAAWRGQTRALAGITALLELGMAAGVTLLLRHLRGQDRLAAAETARARAEADLTLAGEREHAAEVLRTQQQRFDIAAQNMLQGLLMVDGDGNVLVVNRRFCELWGLSADSIVAGMSYTAMTAFVVSHGNVALADVIQVRRRRDEAVGRNARETFALDLSDGRSFMVTHQPMESGWLTTYEDVTDRRLAEARITHLAHYDPLTELPNRVLFHEALEHALAFARRGHLLALHCLDLDQFKAVNDTLGHPVGDRLLQAVAERLRGGVRDTDTVARLGGDEFAIAQGALDGPQEATDLASRLIEILAKPFEIDGYQIIIGTSIGIAFALADGTDADVLLKNADLALYRAKLDGRGTYRLFHTAMDAEMQARRLLELDLRHALQSQQFELFYQPLIGLHTQAASGFEALLRWRHPDRGMVLPDKFIPLAEEIGVILQIGEWALRQACMAAAAWPDDLRVSVNLSPVQFKSCDLVGTVAAAMRDSGLAPDRLELEITEKVMLQDTAATLATLRDLRELGVRIAMDDFGTGYSSLSYLRRFPFDRIKIDQSFVRELGRQRDCAAIVRAVIALGRDLGMATTAEGVETREQLRALAQAGCSDIQGYLFSRPVPLSEIPAVLRSMPTAATLLQQSASDEEVVTA